MTVLFLVFAFVQRCKGNEILAGTAYRESQWVLRTKLSVSTGW